MDATLQANESATELAKLLIQAIERHPEDQREELLAAVKAAMLSDEPDRPARVTALLYGEVAA